MDGTRVRILKEIDVWIRNPEAQRICWITGMAGSGKTSIAKTVCERASTDSDIMLGGSFFCSRTGVAAQREIGCVVPTLAQILARQSMEYSRALVREIVRDRDIQHKHVTVQVKQILYTALLSLQDTSKPVLLVIDALDECGGETAEIHQAVSEMLEALVTALPSSVKLPVKFLVTSRPETHIRDTPVSNAKFSQILRLHTVNKEEIDADIHRYITATLNAKLSIKPDILVMFTDKMVDDLVRLCDGLFIVAATALKHTFSSGNDGAEAMFTDLLNASRDSLNEDAVAPLDHMYKVIVEDAARKSGTKLPALLQLLASLLSTRMKLSIAALADVLAQSPSRTRSGLARLHAVVDVPDDDNMPGLRIIHASFGDYMFHRAPVHIRIPRLLGHMTLAHGCLGVMGRHLRFNISSSVSSYKPNSSTRADSITLSLEYACLHWAHHIAFYKPSDEASPNISTLDTVIAQSFRPKFLFWLEVLSVLYKVGLASGLLLIAGSTVSRL